MKRLIFLSFILALGVMMILGSCVRERSSRRGAASSVQAGSVEQRQEDLAQTTISAEEQIPVDLRVVAVAPFSIPEYDWQLLSGQLPSEGPSVKEGYLGELDAILAGELSKVKKADVVPVSLILPCFSKVGEPSEHTRIGQAGFFAEVGRCVPADFVLVPQVTWFFEREGSTVGAIRPAKVVFDLFLIETRGGRIARQFHFEEEQQALADNLLNMKKFMERKGGWVTAGELAAEGIRKGLKELGL